MQLKSHSPENLDHIVESLKPLYGFRFQEVQTNDQDLLIGLWGEGDLHWIFFDLQPQRPLVFLLPDPSPVKIKAKKKPLQLFLSAHGLGLTFIKAERKPDEGRILRLYFQSPKNPEFACEIEARLFPHGQNILIHSKGKSISFEKVKELPEAHLQSDNSKNFHESQTFERPMLSQDHGAQMQSQNMDEAFSLWLAQRLPKTNANSSLNFEKLKEKVLAKKQKAIETVERELQEKKENSYQELGEWLKLHQTLAVPEKFIKLIDAKQSLSWNMEEAFRKSKQQKEKVQRTQERLTQLQQEWGQLERLQGEQQLSNFLSGSTLQQGQRQPSKASPKSKSEYKGRLLKLDENLEARAGKSGADNLALLRQARAWDFWLHLKDLPGSHAILFRNKNQKVTDHQLRKVASWLVELSLKKKAPEKGEKYQVLVTECRFVRPIKGDKLGRVNYQNERVLTFQYPY